MSSLRVMVKRSRGKKQQEEKEKQQHVTVTENNIFKILLQKVFEIKISSSPASLVVASCGIPHIVEDSRPIDPQCHLAPLLSKIVIIQKYSIQTLSSKVLSLNYSTSVAQ